MSRESEARRAAERAAKRAERATDWTAFRDAVYAEARKLPPNELAIFTQRLVLYNERAAAENHSEAIRQINAIRILRGEPLMIPRPEHGHIRALNPHVRQPGSSRGGHGTPLIESLVRHIVDGGAIITFADGPALHLRQTPTGYETLDGRWQIVDRDGWVTTLDRARRQVNGGPFPSLRAARDHMALWYAAEGIPLP